MLNLSIDTINYTTKTKAKFSYCDQVKFNEPVLEQGTPLTVQNC